MKYIPQIHGVKSLPKAPVILNEDLNEANAPLIGALMNCKRPANPRIAPGLGGQGFTLTGALVLISITVYKCEISDTFLIQMTCINRKLTKNYI
jgi:hypothetical protein